MFYIYRTIFIILIEIFDLFEIKFIYSSTILIYFNDLVKQKEVVIISIFKIILTYYNKKKILFNH